MLLYLALNADVLVPILKFTILTSMVVTNDGYNEQIITVLTIFAITYFGLSSSFCHFVLEVFVCSRLLYFCENVFVNTLIQFFCNRCCQLRKLRLDKLLMELFHFLNFEITLVTFHLTRAEFHQPNCENARAVILLQCSASPKKSCQLNVDEIDPK